MSAAAIVVALVATLVVGLLVIAFGGRHPDARARSQVSSTASPNAKAGRILRGLVEGRLTVRQARAAWPTEPILVPQAESYLAYFEEGLDGRGFRDPGFEQDILLSLADRLERAG